MIKWIYAVIVIALNAVTLSSVHATIPAWQLSIHEAPTDFDWVQTTSNEWLKGKVVSIYTDKLEFDSKEVGIIDIKLKDIKLLKSHNIKSIRTTAGGIVEGRIVLTDHVMHIYQPNHHIKIPIDNVVSMASSERSGESLWSGEIALGAMFRGGNSKQADYTLVTQAKRLSSTSRWQFDYAVNYSETDNEKTEDSQRLKSSFDWFLSRDYFARLPEFEFYRDPFQNIEYRITLGLALGYELYDEPKFEWNITAGPSFQYTQFDKVEQNESDNAKSPVLALGSNYERNLTSDVEVFLNYQMQLVEKKAGNLIHHIETGLEIELGSDFELDVTLYWDRTEEPQANEDGITPDTDDYRIVIGLSYDF